MRSPQGSPPCTSCTSCTGWSVRRGGRSVHGGAQPGAGVAVCERTLKKLLEDRLWSQSSACTDVGPAGCFRMPEQGLSWASFKPIPGNRTS